MKAEVGYLHSDGVVRFYSCSFEKSCCNVICIPNEVYIRMVKIHCHRYEVKYFLYEKLELSFCEFRSLKEMFRFVQNLLEENLSDIVQKGW